MGKRKKPNFVRRAARWLRRLKVKWRYPHGRQAKVRRGFKGRPLAPSIGWGSPKELKGLHPSGYEEVLVHNVAQLEQVNASKQAIRIAARVGRKKRAAILKRAAELNLKVLNP